MQNEFTNDQKMVAQLFSVLCSIVQSEHTPRITVEATMQTLEKIFNEMDGPFMNNEDSQMMTMTMIEAINGIVQNRNKSVRVAEGDSILGNMNWN